MEELLTNLFTVYKECRNATNESFGDFCYRAGSVELKTYIDALEAKDDAGVEKSKAALKDATALVVRNRTKVTADVIAAAPKLKVIARAGVGLDNIDLKAADAAGVVVVAGLGANAVSVGELTLGLALSLLRNIPGHDVATRDGGWVRTPGRELSGLTWGLLGCGATGVATAKLIQGFNCQVIGFRGRNSFWCG